MCQRKIASFFVDDCLVKGALFGKQADIFADITVISLWWAKHDNVCLLTPHKRGVHSVMLKHKQKQTFPLLCRLLSFSFFYFCPFFSERRKDALTAEQPGGLQTTHRAVQESLPALFFASFLSSLPTSLLILTV